MPIVGGTTEINTLTFGGLTAASYNASNYSHSTMVLASALNDTGFSNMNVAPLTTSYTPSTDCVNRWMLAGGQSITSVITIATNYLTTTTVLATASAGVITRMASLTPTPTPNAGDVSRVITSSAALLPRQLTAHSFTVLSMALNGTATDPSYRSCQKYGGAPTYSPGICPVGQTVAEVTAWHVSAVTGYRTFWQASCCRSGMTFGPEFSRACISTFSTPLEAVVLLTTSAFSTASPTLGYEFTTTFWDSSASATSTRTISSTTIITTGLAIADPVVIAWQEENFDLFPPDYVSSLAQRWEISLPSKTGSLPPPPTVMPGLSTGAKAGIGVGAALGAIALVLIIVVLCLRNGRKTKIRSGTQEHTIAEMADQDHDLAKKKWWTGGKWRSEADAGADPQELDNKTVYVVPGPPAELEGADVQHPNVAGRVVYPQRDVLAVGT